MLPTLHIVLAYTMLALRLLSRQTMPGVRRFATYKTSTGLVGLQVDPNGRETLMQLCSDVMLSLSVRDLFFAALCYFCSASLIVGFVLKLSSGFLLSTKFV